MSLPFIPTKEIRCSGGPQKHQAEMFGQYVAVIVTPAYSLSENHFNVAHVPTGCAFAQNLTLHQARTMASKCAECEDELIFTDRNTFRNNLEVPKLRALAMKYRAIADTRMAGGLKAS